jgi:hypothetical protein
VDSFVADLSRLAGLVCAAPDEGLIKCAFVCGLPEAVQTQIQASCLLVSMSLPDIVEKARCLVSRRDVCLLSAQGALHKHPGARKGGRRPSCYECGSEEHLLRGCPSRNKGVDSGRFCFVCGDKGHLSPSCPLKRTQPAKNE